MRSRLSHMVAVVCLGCGGSNHNWIYILCCCYHQALLIIFFSQSDCERFVLSLQSIYSFFVHFYLGFFLLVLDILLFFRFNFLLVTIIQNVDDDKRPRIIPEYIVIINQLK